MSGIKERRITAICDFLLECEEGHLFESSDPAPAECPTCAEVKAAREEGRRQGMDDLAVQGYLTMGNCAHYWDEPGSCPVCIQIKAAEDKRGKEVLEMACKHLPGSWDIPLRQDFEERFSHEQG